MAFDVMSGAFADFQQWAEEHDKLMKELGKRSPHDLKRALDYLGPDSFDEKSALLDALKMAYRKHHLNDESIGWGELSDIMYNTLCNVMGTDAYCRWMKEKPWKKEKL